MLVPVKSGLIWNSGVIVTQLFGASFTPGTFGSVQMILPPTEVSSSDTHCPFPRRVPT